MDQRSYPDCQEGNLDANSDERLCDDLEEAHFEAKPT